MKHLTSIGITTMTMITCAALQAGAASRPNIIVIVVDDQGYADLGAYEHSAPDVQTPSMDRLAACGVLFTAGYTSAPVCSPSRAGWNTGPDGEMRKYYLANLNCLDDNIGRVLDALKELKVADNTVVVFFSDNGGPPTTGAWNRPLAGSKFTLWEGGIRVPFILSRPGDPHAGETWDPPVSTLDVLPTCLEAAGIEIPEGLDGRPIPKSRKETGNPRDLFWRWGNSYAVRSGDWKLLHRGTQSRKPTSGIVVRTSLLNRTCLFNIREDPGESRNLFDSHPEVVQRLQKLYKAWPKEVSLGELFDKIGDRPGPFVVHLNCGDGKQTGELLKREGVVVQGLDTSRKNVEAARRNPAFRKEYGKRITFRWFDGKNLPFMENCVNAIVVDARCEMRDAGEEILRVLCPRGVAVVRQADNREWLSRIPHPASRIGNGFVSFTKPVPPDIDEWTHHMHGPDNNRVSGDTRLAPPLSHLQWTVGPRYTRHHEHMSSFEAMVSARGKVFYIID